MGREDGPASGRWWTQAAWMSPRTDAGGAPGRSEPVTVNVIRSGSKSGRPFTLLGGLLAAGSLAIFAVVSSSLSGAHSTGGGGTQTVVVATRTIPIRTQLQPSDVTLAHWSQGDAPVSAFGRISDVVGMVTAVQMTRGEPLTGNNIARTADLITGGQGSYLPIPEGFV